MKYIVTKNEDGLLELYMFPRHINHDCFLESLDALRTQSFGDWERVYRQPISAGFINSKFECYGSSITLDLESRPYEDTELLKKSILEII